MELPDLQWGMERAYARTGVPQLVRAPWPAPYAARYEDLTVAVVWTPEGLVLRASNAEQSAWRLRDPRWLALRGSEQRAVE